MKCLGVFLLTVVVFAAMFVTLEWTRIVDCLKTPVQSQPSGWVWDMGVVMENLERAQQAINTGKPSEASLLVAKARGQAAAIKADIQRDHAAWLARQYR